ncbi:MAG TPA: YceI family protein [Actinomycetota bacterium]|jgi:polyisoprenoid-binding protein YceI|nr:YceI family protein [Actinomycetota bacterium]
MAQAEKPQVELPAPGVWELDPQHTAVEWVARHLLTKVRGRFRTFTGAIEVAERPEESRVEVEIDTASIDSGTPDRDNHLRSADFLEVETYPKLTFRSSTLRPTGTNSFDLEGELTIRDVTRPVTLQAEYLGVHDSPWGTKVAAFSAATEIDREEFGLTWNVAIETGGWLVSRDVRIELEIEAVYQAEAAREAS